ncbi:hypothetical protein FQR65_LT04170 [Abscondita terminalis]|nr:hypothetical protein FQR65_LT04170 [Abscondita terminalis]
MGSLGNVVMLRKNLNRAYHRDTLLKTEKIKSTQKTLKDMGIEEHVKPDMANTDIMPKAINKGIQSQWSNEQLEEAITAIRNDLSKNVDIWIIIFVRSVSEVINTSSNNTVTSSTCIEDEVVEVYKQAARESLIDSVRYNLYNNGTDHPKYVEIGYSTYLYLEPIIRISCNVINCNLGCNVVLTVEDWFEFLKLQSYLVTQFSRSQEVERSINWSDVKEEDISYVDDYEFLTNNLNIIYNWEFIEGSDRILKNVDIRQYDQLCNMERNDIEELFSFKFIINYRLELLQSYNFVTYFQNFIGKVIEYRRFRKREFEEENDENVYQDIEDVLNSKYNTNSHNTVCIMEILHYYPSYIVNKIC